MSLVVMAVVERHGTSGPARRLRAHATIVLLYSATLGKRERRRPPHSGHAAQRHARHPAEDRRRPRSTCSPPGGYSATSLQAIADAAGLHVQTIYQAFGSKPAVLAAACELAPGDDEIPRRHRSSGRGPRRSWRSPIRARAARGLRHPHSDHRARAGPARGRDPQRGCVLRPGSREVPRARRVGALPRAVGHRGAAGREGRAAPRPDVARAADTMYAISSFEGYELLVTEREMDAGRVRALAHRHDVRAPARTGTTMTNGPQPR